MQNGGLRKRKKRNLAKVKGRHGQENQSDIRLNLNSGNFRDLRRDLESCSLYKNSGRVTRNPNFHTNGNTGYITKSREESGIFEKYVPPKRERFKGTWEREHLLDKYTMQRLKQLIWLGQSTGSFPWRWNSKTRRIDKWRPPFENIWGYQWIIVMIQTVILTVFHVYVFMEAVKAAKTYRTAFQSSFSFLWYTYSLMLNGYMYYYKESTREYINTLLQFNKENVGKYLIHLDGYKDGGGLVINGAIITNFVQVCVSVSFFLVMPYQPWYIFSYIYPKPWYWLVPFAFHEFMLVGQVITNYLLISWLVVAHNNTLNFWLREIHNHYDSDYTIDDLRDPKIAVEMYRKLQVLCKVFNEFVAPMGLPIMKWIIGTAIIPCGYVLIRSMNHLFWDEFPGILTYPLGVIDCATVAFVMTTMTAEVFDLGNSFLDSYSQFYGDTGFRRVLMSCDSLKIWVGRFYFIKVSTTITFFKVVFDLITYCIITFP